MRERESGFYVLAWAMARQRVVSQSGGAESRNS